MTELKKLSPGDIDELERLANAATSGPWEPCGKDRGGCVCRFVYGPDDVVAKATCSIDNDGEGYTAEQATRNAFFIAAANPATVLALLSELSAAQADFARLAELGNLARSRTQAEQDELSALLRKATS